MSNDDRGDESADREDGTVDSGDETVDLEDEIPNRADHAGESEAPALEERSLEDLSPEDVRDLSTDELVELSEGGVVDAEGRATAFPEDQGTEEGPSAEETAEELVDHLEGISQQSRSTQQEMFTDEWMAANTDFGSIEAFLEAGPWEVAPEAGLWDVPVDALDDHARAHSAYDSWEEMSQAAGEEWLDDALDL